LRGLDASRSGQGLYNLTHEAGSPGQHRLSGMRSHSARVTRRSSG
jgi:hypothetical protein